MIKTEVKHPGKIQIGTVGLGLMGSSIVTCILAAGHPVTALTNNIQQKEESIKRIETYLLQLKEEGILKEGPVTILQRLRVTDDYTSFNDHTVVIESIIESIDEKKKVYRQLETAGPGCYHWQQYFRHTGHLITGGITTS